MGRKIDKLEKPVGVDYIWGGQKKEWNRFWNLRNCFIALLSWFT
jgi:hypothetical protein